MEKPCLKDAASTNAMPKQAEELIKEISKLELEVAYMEKYLLSLYRKTFEKRIPSSTQQKNEDFSEKDSCQLHKCNIRRCQSSLSHRFNRPISRRVFYPTENAEAYHSLPLSMLERARFPASTTMSLGEYLDRDLNGNDSETANWVSEEMIKSISEIYCELAEPPLTNHYFPSSNHFGFLAFNSNFDNPFNLEGSREVGGRYRSVVREVGGRYRSVVEVQFISRDSERLKNVGYMLRKYRSLVHRLRQVDPSKMKHEEKIAFWINVHNALVMHAFLVHGVPRNKLKRMSFLLKDSYNIGGHPISLEMIQNCILQCKLLHPGQWLRLLFLSRQNPKLRDAHKTYAISYPEPLLHFALCCGHHSDPAVRVYRPKTVFEELKAAKEEYLHSNLRVQEGKIFLPRLVGTYLKLSGSSPRDLLGILAHIMPEDRTNGVPLIRDGTTLNRIEWISYNYNFRFLFSNELA